MNVNFSAADHTYILAHAHARNDHKVGVVQSKKVTWEKDLQLHIWGISSELAVGRLLGVPIDTVQRLGGDHGVDLKKDGKRYQVKYTKCSWGDLYINVGEAIVCDYLVLTTYANEGINVVGWIDREGFEKAKRKRNFGYGDRWCVGQKDLLPIAKLPGLVVY